MSHISCFLPSWGPIADLVGRAEKYNKKTRKEKEAGIPKKGGRPSRFTEEEIRQIKLDRQAGLTQREIADKLQCPIGSISQYSPVTRTNRKKVFLTCEQKKQIKALYAKGMYQADIAKKYGVLQARISAVLHE